MRSNSSLSSICVLALGPHAWHAGSQNIETSFSAHLSLVELSITFRMCVLLQCVAV